MILTFLMLMMQPAEGQADKAVSIAAQVSGQVYDATRNAQTDVDDAMARARAQGKMALLVLGANWCHDSRDLATWFESQHFKPILDARYVLVFVDVGTPQTGNGRNLDIARRFGIKRMKSTPLVLIASPEGVRLNSKKDAIGWRNAASRSEHDVYRYFAEFTAA